MRPCLLLFWILALTGSGCGWLNKLRPVNRTMTRITGPTGWYRVTPLLGVDLRGNATIPPRYPTAGDEEQPDDDDYDETTPLAERLAARFNRQLSPLIVTDSVPCPYLASGDSAGPVYIFIHGISGPGPEWWPVIPTLMANQPSAMFLFRWNVTQQRALIIDSLVTGLNRITKCHPGITPIVLAHSAGGVVISFAANRLTVDSSRSLEIFTVASPLSGAGLHNRAEEEEGENRFMRDLGSTKTGFPAAAAHVHVTHYRTSYPGDLVMEPKFGQHAPNQPGVGVQGATETDLPKQLTHDGSLLFVARKMVTK